METNQDLTAKIARSLPIIASALFFAGYLSLHIELLRGLAVLALVLQAVIGLRGRSGPRELAMQAVSPASDRKAKTRDLKRALGKSQLEEGAEVYAAQALEQLQQNLDRMTRFEETLNLKMSSQELTYARYAGAAEQVYLAIQAQLNEVAVGLSNVIGAKLQDAGAVAQTLENEPRTQMRSEVLRKISERLQLNEVALTKMDRLIFAISEMKSQSQAGNLELSSLLTELEELAARAKKY